MLTTHNSLCPILTVFSNTRFMYLLEGFLYLKFSMPDINLLIYSLKTTLPEDFPISNYSRNKGLISKFRNILFNNIGKIKPFSGKPKLRKSCREGKWHQMENWNFRRKYGVLERKDTWVNIKGKFSILNT